MIAFAKIWGEMFNDKESVHIAFLVQNPPPSLSKNCQTGSGFLPFLNLVAFKGNLNGAVQLIIWSQLMWKFWLSK